MKNIVIGICAFVLIGILILTVYTIHGRSIRQAELDQALALALEETIAKTGKNHTDGPKSNEEMTTLFLEKFLTQLESNSQAAVHILDADYEKGLLSAEAVLTYQHPTGREGSVSSRQTAIRETVSAQEQEEYCRIDYLVNGSSYKTFQVQKGSSLMVPGAPEVKGKVFQGWKEQEGEGILDLKGRKAERDCTYVAVFQ